MENDMLDNMIKALYTRIGVAQDKCGQNWSAHADFLYWAICMYAYINLQTIKISY